MEVGVRARGAVPDPELSDLARVAVAAKDDLSAGKIQGESERERKLERLPPC